MKQYHRTLNKTRRITPCRLAKNNVLAQSEKMKSDLTAIAIAISDSVTVSMGDETRGAFKVIILVNADLRSTSFAVKSMNPGKIMKSLKQIIFLQYDSSDHQLIHEITLYNEVMHFE